MKRKLITKKTPSDTITIGDIDVNKHYIGVCQSFDHKGFVTRKEYNNGEFTLRCINKLTNGNGWDGYDDVNFNDFIENIANKVSEIYVFDTPEELFRWLAE